MAAGRGRGQQKCPVVRMVAQQCQCGYHHGTAPWTVEAVRFPSRGSSRQKQEDHVVNGDRAERGPDGRAARPRGGADRSRKTVRKAACNCQTAVRSRACRITGRGPDVAALCRRGLCLPLPEGARPARCLPHKQPLPGLSGSEAAQHGLRAPQPAPVTPPSRPPPPPSVLTQPSLCCSGGAPSRWTPSPEQAGRPPRAAPGLPPVLGVSRMRTSALRSRCPGCPMCPRTHGGQDATEACAAAGDCEGAKAHGTRAVGRNSTRGERGGLAGDPGEQGGLGLPLAPLSLEPRSRSLGPCPLGSHHQWPVCCFLSPPNIFSNTVISPTQSVFNWSVS
uniref:translation initiation factor IF-2-like n=1 Tax=Halichoerus grypus TaxID=9711 RepID=UPI001659E785|nr:translation initiation factor IF-2-like [Halichoerus grypus]